MSWIINQEINFQVKIFFIWQVCKQELNNWSYKQTRVKPGNGIIIPDFGMISNSENFSSLLSESASIWKKSVKNKTIKPRR